MIFDKMSNAGKHTCQFPDMKLISEFADKFYDQQLPDGTYELDGRRVFAMIQSFCSKQQTADSTYEAHRDYIDVQFVVDGQEKIQYADLDTVELVQEHYSEGKDIAFYRGEAQQTFVVSAGSFLLLEPRDAHMPGLSVDADAPVRKIVFKIHV